MVGLVIVGFGSGWVLSWLGLVPVRVRMGWMGCGWI